MVEITNSFKQTYAKAIHKARAERIRCVRLRPRLYYVARQSSGHGEYLVEFFIVQTIRGGEEVKAGCVSVRGEKCRGTFGDIACVHISKAFLRAYKHGRELQKQEAAA